MSEKTETTGKGTNQETVALTAEEIKRLASCEASIRNGLKSYQNIGRALAEISSTRLYRGTHSTFVNYLKEKWDMTSARASQYIHAYRVHVLFTSQGFTTLPTTESQCRPLARIPEDEYQDARMIKVWQAVLDAKVNITALFINSQVDKELGIKDKAENAAPGGESATGTEPNAKASTDGTSGSAEQRAELREAKKRIAQLESMLAAEKSAHARTKAAGGIPKSAKAAELFKAGFRALAKKYHPDHGGSVEDMQELNKLKEVLLPS